MPRGDVLQHTEKLVVEQCCNCSINFAMPEYLRNECVEKQQNKPFYCPNGHRQWYTGKSEAQRLREQLEQANNRLVHRQNTIDNQRREIDMLERSNRSVRAHAKRIKTRAASGVCPVDGCKRHFENLQRHIAEKHPSWKKEETGVK